MLSWNICFKSSDRAVRHASLETKPIVGDFYQNIYFVWVFNVEIALGTDYGNVTSKRCGGTKNTLGIRKSVVTAKQSYSEGGCPLRSPSRDKLSFGHLLVGDIVESVSCSQQEAAVL